MDIKKLLSQMTLEQKLAQLSQYNAEFLKTDANAEITGPAAALSLTKSELNGVGSVLNFYGADNMKEIQAQHLSDDENKIPLLFMMDVIHGYRTIYPIPLALGASFDRSLSKKCCQMAAKEAAVGGVQVTFAPMVDLVRDPRWGRCMESTGEDPYLNAELSIAMVEGFQGDMKGEYNIAACLKHFACYGAPEGGRDYDAVDMSERTMRDYYFPAYKAAVDADVKMAMTSFNTLNGVPSSANQWLIKDVLRSEWGYDGIVISDYNAFGEMITHGYCENEKVAAERAMNAGSEIEMMSTCYLHNIPKLIEEGKLTMEQVDEAVLRVLKLKDEMGMFENPYKVASKEQAEAIHLCPEHRALAREAAEKCAVLLKNDNVLPFSKNVKKVAVVGPYANVGMIGGWECHGKEEEAVSVFEGVKNLLQNAQVFYEKGCNGNVNEKDCSDVEKAAKLASECDVAIVCVGENRFMSGESNSRAEIHLNDAEKELIRKVVKANANTVVVLFNGRPLVLTDILDDAPAFMTMWQPGTEGGAAAANLIFGNVNFSGRLPMTFPKSEGQIPVYYNKYHTGRPNWSDDPNCGYCNRYIDMTNSPLFPFGYGLSYTKYEISKPVLSKETLRSGETLEVSVTVKNVGERDGEIPVQMYIFDEFASLVRPIKEMKGFEKVFLKAQEEKKVTFEITEETLRFWSANNKFEAEKGWFTVWVAQSSEVGEGVRFELK